MEVRKGEPIKNGSQIIGNRTRVKIVKNKVAPPFKECEFDIMFGQGISRVGEVLDLAVDLDIVKKGGSWFSYNDQKLGQGRDNVKEILANNPELMKEIEGKILERKDKLLLVSKKSKKSADLKKAADEALADTEEIPEETPADAAESYGADISPIVNAEDDFEEFTPAE